MDTQLVMEDATSVLVHFGTSKRIQLSQCELQMSDHLSVEALRQGDAIKSLISER